MLGVNARVLDALYGCIQSGFGPQEPVSTAAHVLTSDLTLEPQLRLPLLCHWVTSGVVLYRLGNFINFCLHINSSFCHFCCSLFLCKGRYLCYDALLSTMQAIILCIITVYGSSNSIYSYSCGLLQQAKLQSAFRSQAVMLFNLHLYCFRDERSNVWLFFLC